MSLETHRKHRGWWQLLHLPNAPEKATLSTTFTSFSQCAHGTLLEGDTRYVLNLKRSAMPTHAPCCRMSLKMPVAEAIAWCAARPESVNIQEVLMTPRVQSGGSMIARGADAEGL